ncbi:MAG TPA: metallophosphoesterase [Chloroflexota bacterium]
MAPRVVFMSDIHGNFPALRAVVDALPTYDAAFVAGDLCLEGPCPAQVVDLLRELGWTVVMGNTDRDLIAPPDGGKRTKRDRVDWTRRQLGPERLNWLKGLPFSARFADKGTDAVLVVHANPLDMDRHLRPDMTEAELDPFLASIDTNLLAFGHLHTPYIRPVGDVLLMDVSSVGHPKDHDRRSAFTVVTWDDGHRTIEQVRVPYDIEETVHLLRHSGIPEAEEQVEALLRASY